MSPPGGLFDKSLVGVLGVGTPVTLRLRALATVEVTLGVRPGGCSIVGALAGRWDAHNEEPPAVDGESAIDLAGARPGPVR